MTLNNLKVNGPVYQRIVQGKDLIADVLPPPEYIIESYLVTLQLAASDDKAEQDALAARLKTLKADYDTRHEFWLKEQLDSNLSDIFLRQAHQPAMAFYAAAFDELIPAAQKADNAGVAAAMVRLKAFYATHRAAVDEVVTLTTKRIAEDESMAKERIESATLLLMLILAASLGASVLVAAVIVRGLLTDLGGEPHYAVEITRQIASGDLTMDIAVKNNDQQSLLYSMKSMQAVLADTVAAIKAAVESVSTGSHQIAAGNFDLSARTEHQASSLEQTAASMEELTGTIKQNAESARRASDLANSASNVAVKGGAVVSEVVATMQSIDASAKKIVDIISVIDGIAFQTNILALNAAVEAARAGEQGRGFAVVAAEVRVLAQRSAAAAKEIKALIGDSVERVGTGARLVDQAGSTMEEVVASIQRVSGIISEIASASVEQQTGIEQVNQAMSQMDQVTQQNAALVEEASAAAKSLQDQANHLTQTVARFKADGAAQSALPAPVLRLT
ncbi:MAG TPA: methyl-accepting chemotaxis protein [Noviherbaspirillum sp.]|uniref:methyl-accepting chemotaxis protein n=1 Tax=Noviherbaspirillum sp. TaxID=1926288 RepID=UPI002DDCEEBD|nr:methyl-accepting chemotaxis protein [Noviherbaspirillum sp.]HEV2608724.1 methyl-accepting chemotaxis protein [Noviherbaspirillum sp.]